MKSKTPNPDRWTFFQKAFLLMTFVAAGGIVYTGFWIRNILEHTQFKTQSRFSSVNNGHTLALPSASASLLKKTRPALPAPAPIAPIPPSNELYAQAQKAFEKGDYPEAYRLLDLLLKTYPHALEVSSAQQSLNVVIQAMLFKASGGINPLDIHPVWHYQTKDNNIFAIIDNSVTPSTQPTMLTPQESGEDDNSSNSDSSTRSDSNSDTSVATLPDPSEQNPHYTLGVIHAPVDDGNSLYGLAIYGIFSDASKDCGHPNLCQLRLTIHGQSILTDVSYQDGGRNGALKLTNPNQVVDILNQLPTNSDLQVVLDGNPIRFNLNGLNWRQLKVNHDEVGHLHQDVQALQADQPASSSSTPSNPPANSITIASPGG